MSNISIFEALNELIKSKNRSLTAQLREVFDDVEKALSARLSRLRRVLLSRSIPSVIEFMEPDEYMAWLAGRPDTEAERANWAATLQN